MSIQTGFIPGRNNPRLIHFYDPTKRWLVRYWGLRLGPCLGCRTWSSHLRFLNA